VPNTTELQAFIDQIDWNYLTHSSTNSEFASQQEFTIDGYTGKWVFSSPFSSKHILWQTAYLPNDQIWPELQEKNAFIRYANQFYYADSTHHTIELLTDDPQLIEQLDNYLFAYPFNQDPSQRLTVADLLKINLIIEAGIDDHSQSNSALVVMKWNGFYEHYPAFEVNGSVLRPYFQGQPVSDPESANYVLECYLNSRVILLNPFGNNILRHEQQIFYVDMVFLLPKNPEEIDRKLNTAAYSESFWRYLNEQFKNGSRKTVLILQALLHLQASITDDCIKNAYISINVILSVLVFRERNLPVTVQAMDILVDIIKLEPTGYHYSSDKLPILIETISKGLYAHALMYVAVEKPERIHDLLSNIRTSNDREEINRILNMTNCNGRTALICAAFVGNGAVVNALIDAGANINCITHLGNTALSHAISQKHNDIVATLLHHHADISPRNHEGKNAFDLVLEHIHYLNGLFIHHMMPLHSAQQREILKRTLDGKYTNVFAYAMINHPDMFHTECSTIRTTNPWYGRVQRMHTALQFIARIGLKSYLTVLERELNTNTRDLTKSDDEINEIRKFYVSLNQARIDFLRSTDDMDISKLEFKQQCLREFHQADYALIERYHLVRVSFLSFFSNPKTPFILRYEAMKATILDMIAGDDTSYVML